MNPYIERLAAGVRDLDSAVSPENSRAIADWIYTGIVAPKNQRIHDLTGELMKLQASLHKLDKVLAVHNAGVCRDGEPPVDCAIRLLSPVPDSLPKRDRP